MQQLARPLYCADDQQHPGAYTLCGYGSREGRLGISVREIGCRQAREDMRVEFQLKVPFAGFAAETAAEGAVTSVIMTEALTSHDGALLTWRLENLHAGVFSEIPDIPPPSLIDNILVIIYQDRNAVAYVNELRPRALVRYRTAVKAGDAVLVRDITDITSFDLGVEIPNNAGFILVRSFGWRKSLFYDVRPLHPAAHLRTFDIRSALAHLELKLYQHPFSEATDETSAASPGPREMEIGDGLALLTRLLGARCTDEARYQELLEAHPWILGGYYRSLHRHEKFDDENIPDFVALRHHDDCHDIIELKQPFLPCFRQSGGFTSEFNDAWNQAERYLIFARKNADYLRRQKSFHFENPRCLLVMGYRFSQEELRAIRDKESCNLAISVISYDQLAAKAEALASMLKDNNRS